MGLKDAWKALRGNATTSKSYSSQGATVSYHQTGYSNSTARDSFSDLARDGYVENAIVYRCVNEIANGVGTLTIVGELDNVPQKYKDAYIFKGNFK